MPLRKSNRKRKDQATDEQKPPHADTVLPSINAARSPNANADAGEEVGLNII